MMRKKKRRSEKQYFFAMLSVFIVAFVALASVFFVQAAPDSDDGATETTSSTTLSDKYNIMLVIDKSGSMRVETDPDGVAIDAAKMFVDSVNADNCNIGVVAFNHKAELLQGLTDISSESAKAELKRAIGTIHYDGDTDIGAAMKLATDTLALAAENDRKNLIIFLTDGKTDKVDLDASEKMLEQALKKADQQHLSCEVYAIGLNHKNDDGSDSIDPEGVERIKTIANTTQIGNGVIGSDDNGVNYLITDKATEIYAFYRSIFAKLQGGVQIGVEGKVTYDYGEDNPYTRFVVPVTGTMVKEVIIHLIADSDIDVSTVWVRNPGEDYIPTDNTDSRLEMHAGKRYVFIRLERPEAGDWWVEVKGIVDHRMTYVVVSDIEVEVSHSVHNKDVEFDVAVKSGDSYVQEKDLYDSLTKKQLTIKDSNGNVVKEEELEYNDSRLAGKGALYKKVTGLSDGEYECHVEVRTSQVVREVYQKIQIDTGTSSSGTDTQSSVTSEYHGTEFDLDSLEVNVLKDDTVEFEVGIKPKDTSLTPSDIYNSLSVHELKITDENGNEVAKLDLSFDQSRNGGKGALFAKSGVLQIGKYKCKASVANSESSEDEDKDFEIKAPSKLWLYICIGVGALLLLIVALYLIWRNYIVTLGGVFYVHWTMRDEQGNVIRAQSLTSPLKGMSFSLWRLVENSLLSTRETQELKMIKDEFEKSDSIRNALQSMKVCIVNTKDGDGNLTRTYMIKQGKSQGGGSIMYERTPEEIYDGTGPNETGRINKISMVYSMYG